MDQNGSVHEFEYDRLGRQIVDKATTLGTDVDDVVRRVEREYGVHGMLERTANYDATTAGSVVNDVEFTYNGFGQLAVDSQEHDGEVDGNTLDVQYAHVAGASNLYRRALTTYPNGRVLYYYYGGICGYISRPYYVRDYPTANDTCHGVYYYQGLDEIIRHTVNLSGVVTLNREYDNGSGGYSDRFGRLTNLYWYSWGLGACDMQVKHDYDRAGNRLCREDVLAKSQGTPIYIDELYTYDGMHQLTAQQRGELNVAHDALVANSKTFAEQWTLDPTGNWSEFKQDTDGDGDWDLDQDRDHTTANEVLEIDDATTHVAHDRAGNMTRIPKPSDWSSHYHLAYDAWNRLVCVYDSDGETPISAYYYDGLGRRVIKDVYDEGSLTSRRHYYYSDKWQVLEERLETSDGSGGFDTAIVDRQYVWGLRYVDDLLSRDRNTDGTSTGDYGKTGSGLDERIMALQDDNYNVCAIANTTGVCLERYNYTSYGESNCLTPAFADRASTDYDWDILYTGRQYDSETGLYQYRNRYYHPQLGRFVNRDPIGYGDGSINLYSYSQQNTGTFQYRQIQQAATPEDAEKEREVKKGKVTFIGCSDEQIKQIRKAGSKVYQAIMVKECLKDTGLEKCFYEIFGNSPMRIYCDKECVEGHGGWWRKHPLSGRLVPGVCSGSRVGDNLPVSIGICVDDKGNIPRPGYTLEEILMHELLHECGLRHDGKYQDTWQGEMFEACLKKCFPNMAKYKDADPCKCKIQK